jgi:hypothetical protein
MKVFDLSCEREHVFEGWFASHADFDQQQATGRIECPLCGSKSITKRLSAPRLNVSHLHRDAPRGGKMPPAGSGDQARQGGTPDQAVLVQRRVLELVREVVKNTEDVGERFPEEARRIHSGASPERGIRGQASPEERAELAEEGIETLALPFAHLLKDGMH